MLSRIIILSFFVAFLANCSDVAFETVQKQAAMKTSVLGNNIPDERNPATNQNQYSNEDDGDVGNENPLFPNIPNLNIPNMNVPDENNSGSPNSSNPTANNSDSSNPNSNGPDLSNLPDGQVGGPASYFCSDSRSKDKGNIITSTDLTLNLHNSSGALVCSETDDNFIRQNLGNKALILRNCTLADGQYSFRLMNERGENLSYDSNTIKVQSGNITVNKPVDILMDSNPDKNDSSGVPAYAGTPCDRSASPLYIDLRRDGDPTGVLSSPEEGVLFDILGANGTPAYSKNQISWFKRGRFGLLTLPNSRGEVLGIDQLFGDNTLGPDGQFSDNGFLALAKYDDNGDKKIDKNDAVFGDLRLWLDSNSDGTSSRRELKTLRRLKIESIDLEYDPNYAETDEHGNEIKYKSVVKFANGSMRSIFDIWFILK